MRVMIKVKKDQADKLLATLKARGFKPEPDRPVTIDRKAGISVLMGELPDEQFHDVATMDGVDGISSDPSLGAFKGPKG